MRTLRAGPRRVVPAALILLGIGAVLARAQDGKKDKPGDRGKPPAAKPGEKMFKFEAAGEPWPRVFEWLAKETGKPVFTPLKVTGTFSVQVPKDASYSLPDTIDLINEALIEHKYILIQRRKSFGLMVADEKIDPVNVEHVELADLPKHGQTEVVEVDIPVVGQSVEDAKDEIQGMLSKFGSVNPVRFANKLRIIDSVRTIQRVSKLLKENEKVEGVEQFTHVCKYARAADVEKVLKDLLGEPAKQQAQPQQPGRPQQPPPPGPPAPAKRLHRISSDDSKNMVLVTGPADIIAKAKEIVNKLDVGTVRRIPPGEGKLASFDVPSGQAEAIAQVIRQKFAKEGDTGSVRVSTAGTSTVLVFAYADDLFTITKLIKEATEGGAKFEVVPVPGHDATKLSDTLYRMFVFGDFKVAAPTIEAVPDQNAIMVRGTADQVKQVVAAIKAITGSDGTGADAGRMRVFTIDKGSASNLAEALERMLKQTRKNPVTVISPTRRPGGGIPRPKPPEKEEKKKDD